MQKYTHLGAILYTLFACLFPVMVTAQVVNVDREIREDSLHHKWGAFVNMSVSSDKQKKTLLDLSGNIEVDRYFSNNYLLLALFRTDAVLNGRETIQNEGLFHLRFRDRDSRKVSPESFLQYQWNGAWGMISRYVAGANMRFKFLEERKADLYLASGFFYEWERWNWSGVSADQIPPDNGEIFRSMLRFNQYVKYAVKINETLDFSTIGYLQFPLIGRFLQPRWYMDANLFFQASKRLNLVLHWDHILDRNRVVPIAGFFYTFSTGLQYAL